MVRAKIVLIMGLMVVSGFYVCAEQSNSVVMKKKKKQPVISNQDMCDLVAGNVHELSKLIGDAAHTQSIGMDYVRNTFEGNTAGFDRLSKEQKHEALVQQKKYEEAIHAFRESTEKYNKHMASLTE